MNSAIRRIIKVINIRHRNCASCYVKRVLSYIPRSAAGLLLQWNNLPNAFSSLFWFGG